MQRLRPNQLHPASPKIPRSPMTAHHAQLIGRAITAGKPMRLWAYGCAADGKYDPASRIVTPTAFREYCKDNPEWATRIKVRLAKLRRKHNAGKGTFQRSKTHCPKGHEYDNTYMKHGKPARRCKTCFNTGAKLRYHATKQKQDDPQFQLRKLMRASATKNKIKVSHLDSREIK